MIQDNEEKYLNDVKQKAQLYGVTISDSEARDLLRHLDLVIEANKSVNLTRITSVRDGINLHIVDSLLYIAADLSMRESRSRLLDIGTGAGYPGIPIDICSSVNVTMIDSVGKKVRVLQSFVNELGLDSKSECIKSRAEELAQQRSGTFEYVTARAVAQLSTLIEYATPFLIKNGKAIFSKGCMSDDEIEQAQITAKICGMKLVSRETFELPEESGHRELLTYVRERDSKVNLPRRNGLAKSEPLYLKHH